MLIEEDAWVGESIPRPLRCAWCIISAMRERETHRREMTGTTPADRAVGEDALIEVNGGLRKVVGYPCVVRITPRLAELIAPTEQDSARGESLESRLRDILWLAGIALDDMAPHDRLAPFDMMLGRVTTKLAACFDTTEGLAIQIIVVEE